MTRDEFRPDVSNGIKQVKLVSLEKDMSLGESP